jgi:hypothetical protein
VSADGRRIDCLAGGAFTLIAVVPRCAVMRDGTGTEAFSARDVEPTAVCLTACREHVRPVRRWLEHVADPIAEVLPELGIEVEVIVGSTDFMREHWNQIQKDLGPSLPIHGYVAVSA